MKRAQKYILFFLVLIIIVGGVIIAVRERPEQEPEEEAVPSVPEVKATIVERGEITQSTWLTGEVRADRTVEVAAKIAGQLEHLFNADGELLEEGDLVDKGEPVAILDHEELEAAVNSAKAAHQSSMASREMARVAYLDAKREKERWARLREQGVGTQQTLDQAETAYEQTKAEFNAAERQVEQAKAQLEQARVKFRQAWVRAPFSGVVSRKYVDPGAFVGPNAPLFRLIDIDKVEITGGLAGKHYPRIKPEETEAVAWVDAYPEERFNGYVSRLRPELEPSTRTVPVTIRLANPDHRLKPGMYARLEVVVESKDDVLLIPDSAVLEDINEKYVYLIEDGVIRRVTVDLGLREGPVYEVISGLEEGDKVAVSGHYMLEDGMEVKARLNDGN